MPNIDLDNLDVGVLAERDTAAMLREVAERMSQADRIAESWALGVPTPADLPA